MTSTRTKIYLLVIFCIAAFLFLAYQNNQPKKENFKHSEIQPIKNPVFVIEKNNIEINTEKLLESCIIIQGNFGGMGSGFAIESEGTKYVLTANHVTSHGHTKFNLGFYHREPNKHPVTVLGYDELLDVSILQFDPKEDISDIPTLKLGDSDNLKHLDRLIYVGNPWPVQFIIDLGKVISPQSNLINQLQGANHPACLIHDCPTSQGCSGGAIINTHGEVVAINQRFLPNRPSFIHYAACESNAIKLILEDLKKGGKVNHWDVQILVEMKHRLNNNHLSISNLKKAPKNSGLVIFSILEKTAAHNSELKLGDIILEIDGKPIKSVQDFYYHLHVTPHDENFEPKFKIDRDGKEINITVKKLGSIDPIPDNFDELIERLLNPENK